MDDILRYLIKFKCVPIHDRSLSAAFVVICHFWQKVNLHLCVWPVYFALYCVREFLSPLLFDRACRFCPCLSVCQATHWVSRNIWPSHETVEAATGTAGFKIYYSVWRSTFTLLFFKCLLKLYYDIYCHTALSCRKSFMINHTCC